MDRIAYIKSEIERLYKTNPTVHVTLKLSRPKLWVKDTPVTIVGVYRNFFRIEERHSGHPLSHTLQYGDLLIGHVTVREVNLDLLPEEADRNRRES